MNFLQKTLEEAIANLPAVFLERAIAKKLSEQGIKPTKKLCSKLARHILDRTGQPFKYQSTKYSGTVSLVFTEADSDEITKAIDNFTENHVAKNSDDRRSNLFTQLYRKMRLLKKVRNMDEEMAADALAKRWSLGKNGVVRKAAHALANNCSEAWMVALVPDTKANAHAFFQATLSTPPRGLTDWEYANFGYLTWEEFEAHCRTNAAEWPETLANFEFNRGQIFGLHETAEPPPPRSVVTWNSPSGPQQVTIKNRHKHNTRVYLSDGTSQRVSNRDLEW